MSPSEEKGIALGLVLEKVDRALSDAQGRARRFFRFRVTMKNRRHYLNVTWHTRAGAWQAAVRWARKLETGVLR